MYGVILLGLLASVTLGAFIIDEIDDNNDDNSTPAPDDGTSGQDTLPIADSFNLIDGTAGDDNITGQQQGDRISTFEGDDVISAQGGSDQIFAGSGDDLVAGGTGNDTIFGGPGEDFVIGGAGNDLVQGNADDDIVFGIDLGMSSLSATDLAAVDFANDDALLPGVGEDRSGADTLLGGKGDDDLFLGDQDLATGGEGIDTFVLGDWMSLNEDANDAVTITDFSPGTELINYIYTDTGGPAPTVTISPTPGGDALVSVDGVVVAVVTGAGETLTLDDIALVARPDDTETPPDPEISDPDLIRGTDEDDAITGRLVGDQILGRDGDDTISASGGRDEVFAGIGNDLVAGGNASDDLWGGPGDDTLIGGQGGDVLRGTSGNDLLIGVGVGLDNISAEALAAAVPAGGVVTPLDFDLPLTPEQDGQWRDDLQGGSGNDILVLGARDTGTGGLGADQFWIVEWGQSETAVAQIADYDPTEDQIVYVHSAASDSEPLPVLTFGQDGSGNGTILADGVLVGIVAGATGSLGTADVGIVTRQPAPA